MATSEAFARIELELPEGMDVGSSEGLAMLQATHVYLGLPDVKDCFHRLKAPLWLTKYFALPPVPARVVGLGD